MCVSKAFMKYKTPDCFININVGVAFVAVTEMDHHIILSQGLSTM